MNVLSVNLDKVSKEIDNILTDIKACFEENSLNNINIPDSKVNADDFENACKIFGVGNDK